MLGGEGEVEGRVRLLAGGKIIGREGRRDYGEGGGGDYLEGGEGHIIGRGREGEIIGRGDIIGREGRVRLLGGRRG